MGACDTEQLVHGYLHGHERLAGSVRLPARDAELITRLSDLSGSLSDAPAFGSYLTVYPLPSGAHFAVARTWPDPHAGRAGCVLTHTLLVPMSTWTTLAEPRVLDSLFAFPSDRQLAGYTSRLAIPAALPAEQRPLDENGLLAFVQRYFGEGTRPIVWFGQRRSEEVLWRLLRGLWPSLRTTFSACTWCLQPRTLEDRAFDVMFAPPEVHPRFLKMPATQFIEARVPSPGAQETEAWCRAWAERLFGPTPPGSQAQMADLWAQLDDSPAAVRRLYVIEGLVTDSTTAPEMLVGAMDLVESLAGRRDTAAPTKRRVAARAISAAREAQSASGLECLRLIEDRLHRVSFLDVEEALGPALSEAAAAHACRSPDITIQAAAALPRTVNLKGSWLGRGLLQGLSAIARDDPSGLLALWTVPAMAKEVLAAEPAIAAVLFPMSVDRLHDPSRRAEMLSWLGDVADGELRSIIRSCLLPVLGASDLDVLAAVLRDVHAEEVGVVLDALWRRMDALEPPGVCELVVDSVARHHPREARAWARRLPTWNGAVTTVFVATFAQTPQGLGELLDPTEPVARSYADIVAEYLRLLGGGRYPRWLMDGTQEQIRLLSALLAPRTEASAEVVEQTTRLLAEVPHLPIAQSPSLLGQVLDSAGQSFFGALRDVTMRSLVGGFVGGTVTDAAMRSFQEQPAILPWFEETESSDLRAIVSQERTLATAEQLNAWRWTATAPTTLYSRDGVLRDLIDGLLRSSRPEWPKGVSDAWCQVLRRAKVELSVPGARLGLCVQALRFCFNNTRLPLGSVVGEAFRVVYDAVTESSVLPPETMPLFGLFDWDKGKELRRDLVGSFLRSTWAPGDLILAAADVKLLRKIVKRLTRRHGGEALAQAALADLAKRADPRSASLVSELRKLLANPGFHEDWD